MAVMSESVVPLFLGLIVKAIRAVQLNRSIM
jgi:hypothetical protein